MNYILVARVLLHGRRSALHMHQTQTRLSSSNRCQQIRIRTGRNIINNMSPCGQGTLSNDTFVGIDADESSGLTSSP